MSQVVEVVVVSDEHSYRRDNAVWDHVQEHHPNPYAIIRNGDILDMGEASPFAGPIAVSRLIEEYNSEVQFTKNLLERFPSAKFIFNTGNHENRLGRTIQKFAPGFAQLGVNSDITQRLATGQTLALVAPDPRAPMSRVWDFVETYPHFKTRIMYQPGINAYATLIGTNCLVLHAAKAYKLSSTQARLWVADFITPRWPSARIIIQGHTHRRCDHALGAIRYIETGCACNPGGYEEVFGRSTWPPVNKGYVVLKYDLDARLVDRNDIILYDLGYASNFAPKEI